MIDDSAKDDAKYRDQQHVRPAYDRGRKHRLGLEIRPKRDGKPQIAGSDIRDQRVK